MPLLTVLLRQSTSLHRSQAVTASNCIPGLSGGEHRQGKPRTDGLAVTEELHEDVNHSGRDIWILDGATVHALHKHLAVPVSYTHLTLPTKA